MTDADKARVEEIRSGAAREAEMASVGWKLADGQKEIVFLLSLLDVALAMVGDLKTDSVAYGRGVADGIEMEAKRMDDLMAEAFNNALTGSTRGMGGPR